MRADSTHKENPVLVLPTPDGDAFCPIKTECIMLNVKPMLRRSRLTWTECESKIRKLARAASGELTEEQSRRLLFLEQSASRHAGKSPRHVLEQAKRIVR